MCRPVYTKGVSVTVHKSTVSHYHGIHVGPYFRLLRVKHYIKNSFIFLPLLFGAQLTSIPALNRSIAAFFGFSLAASSVYILNDYIDIDEDRHHPEKKSRPLASGAVRTVYAFILMAVFFCAGSAVMITVSMNACCILWAYVVLNIAYTLFLKRVAVLDVSCIAAGFVLRIFAGSAVTGIVLSKWIVVLTFLLALFLALAKRRDDLILSSRTGEKMRKANAGYTLEFVNATMVIMASVVIVSYILYTTSSEVIQRLNTPYVYLTALFVILGVMRYMQITFVFKQSGSPTRVLLTDHFLQAVLIGWILTFIWILYL